MMISRDRVVVANGKQTGQEQVNWEHEVRGRANRTREERNRAEQEGAAQERADRERADRELKQTVIPTALPTVLLKNLRSVQRKLSRLGYGSSRVRMPSCYYLGFF